MQSATASGAFLASTFEGARAIPLPRSLVCLSPLWGLVPLLMGVCFPLELSLVQRLESCALFHLSFHLPVVVVWVGHPFELPLCTPMI